MKKLLPRAGQFIALTGNVGSGKSFILKILAKNGFKTFQLDDYAKSLVKSNKGVEDKIKKEFPAVFKNAIIDNAKLAGEVFACKKSLEILEKIIHPLTFKKILQLKDRAKKAQRSIVVESALIFEKNRQQHFDYIINVSANSKLRYKRLQNQRYMTTEMFENVANLQWPVDKTFGKSHFVIYNESRLHTIKAVNKLMHYGYQRSCA